MKSRTLKSLVSIGLLMATSLALVNCGDDGASANNNLPEQSELSSSSESVTSSQPVNEPESGSSEAVVASSSSDAPVASSSSETPAASSSGIVPPASTLTELSSVPKAIGMASARTSKLLKVPSQKKALPFGERFFLNRKRSFVYVVNEGLKGHILKETDSFADMKRYIFNAYRRTESGLMVAEPKASYSAQFLLHSLKENSRYGSFLLLDYQNRLL